MKTIDTTSQSWHVGIGQYRISADMGYIGIGKHYCEYVSADKSLANTGCNISRYIGYDIPISVISVSVKFHRYARYSAIRFLDSCQPYKWGLNPPLRSSDRQGSVSQAREGGSFRHSDKTLNSFSGWSWILVCMTVWVADWTPPSSGWHESKNWIIPPLRYANPARIQTQKTGSHLFIQIVLSLLFVD